MGVFCPVCAQVWWRISNVCWFSKAQCTNSPQNYPMLHPQGSLESFAEAKVFSTLALVSGFHLISIVESHRNKTAFRGTKGLYEYTVMPMGLVNAPAIFQWAWFSMHDALGPLRGYGGCCVVHPDDIIIFFEVYGRVPASTGSSAGCIGSTPLFLIFQEMNFWYLLRSWFRTYFFGRWLVVKSCENIHHLGLASAN